ncbi:MAG TPA: ABC transporter permease [Thermoanaerobaculia bacterium]|nr:ABC transporter permease [Thermoanaerobaculia bacterium]
MSRRWGARIATLGAAWRSAGFRLRTLFGRAALERDDDEEVRFHLEMAASRHAAQGMGAEEARAAARREFGAVDALREASRDERGIPWLETTLRDLRWAARSLRRAPAFTATVLVMVALGVAGVAAIVPIVRSVLVSPLPFPQPERLVALWESEPQRGWEQAQASPANLLDWREQLRSFGGGITGHSWPTGWALGGGGGASRAERVGGVNVVAPFFSVLGVKLALGRDFRRDEQWASGERVAIISHELWQRRFGGAAGVIGRRLELDGAPHTIVGVAPAGFGFPQPGLDLWVPFEWYPRFRALPWFRIAHYVKPIARLAPGVSAGAAASELRQLAVRLSREHAEMDLSSGAGLTPLREWVVGEAKQRLLVLLGAVVLLLLVACANVASLLFARASVRTRELSVRSALGAARSRLVRQLLTESLLLASVGGALGTALGFAGTRLLVALAGETLPRHAEVGVDGGVLGVALLVILATGLVFGVGPGLRAAAVAPAAAMRGEGRGATGDRELLRSRGWLMLAEVAMATVLVAGAGLAIRSLTELLHVDAGFEPRGRVAVSYDLPAARYADNAAVEQMHRRLLARVRALPGVAAAELVSSLALEQSQWTSDFIVEGRPATAELVDFNRRIVTPGYFAALGVRRLSGPGFRDGDDERAAPVVVVNATLARRAFPGVDPVGKHIGLQSDSYERPLWRTIVGVVADEKVDGLGRPAPMEVFLPLRQELMGHPGLPLRTPTLVLRAAVGDPSALLPVVRRAVGELDPDLPLYDARTLAGMVQEGSARERLLMVLLATFAVLALVLATVGVYGLIAFLVAQRRREIGIRLALGAGAGDVVQTIVGRAALLCGGGLVLGLVVALLAGRTLRGLLYGVEPADPATLLAAASCLALAAVLAGWWPARQATRVSPLETLRE